jgi:hypothetical protein
MFTVFKDLCEQSSDEKDDIPARKMLAFFKTLDETLGSGIGSSLSPRAIRSCMRVSGE